MQLTEVRHWARDLLLWLVVALLFFISIVSVNHLFPFWNGLVFSSTLLGLAGWAAVILSIIYLSRRFRRQIVLVFLLFFCIGFWRGPFLEPPADPFEHLKRIHSYCEKTSDQMPRENKGIWHYSMAGNLICSDPVQMDPESKLRRIDATHGLFLGILISGLFILARRAGLTGRWAFFSCLVAFLFMGTNRFSYFSYYSLAPASTSLLIYWLWTAAFFFRRNRQGILAGVGTALLCFPILWINHRQESVFLGFIVIVYLLVNATCFMLRWRSKRHETKFTRDARAAWYSLILTGSFFCILFTFLFILPQFDFFKQFAADFFVRDLWQHNQGAVVLWHGFHLWGKIWSFRVNDTLGVMGIVMAVLVLPFFWPGLIRIKNEKKIRICILALLPFLGYCIPFFHFIWLSNVQSYEYYRLCYSSMFWLLFAVIFQGLEGRLWLAVNKIKKLIVD